MAAHNAPFLLASENGARSLSERSFISGAADSTAFVGRFAGSDVAGKLWKQKSAPKALRVQLLPKELGSCRRRISFRYEAVSQLWFLSCFPYCSDLGGYS